MDDSKTTGDPTWDRVRNLPDYVAITAAAATLVNACLNDSYGGYLEFEPGDATGYGVMLCISPRPRELMFASRFGPAYPVNLDLPSYNPDYVVGKWVTDGNWHTACVFTEFLNAVLGMVRVLGVAQ